MAEIVAGVDDDRSCMVLVAPGRSLDVEDRVLDVRAAKGLEFDVVVVVEPAEIEESGPQGRADLYVALTRAAQQLFVVHSGRLPEVFADLPQCCSGRAVRRQAPRQ